jgi:GR25 family glycosyltransferase involved in LPS biosynthesis
MANPFDRFDKIYLINLDSRPDRLELANKELERAGILERTERFPAIALPRDPARGNHLSHASCIRKARNFGANNCLILEDDVEWLIDPLELKRVTFPKNWDLVYLGINMDAYSATQVDYHLAKLSGGFSTHAYAINKSLFDCLIELNEDITTIHNDVRMSYEIIPNYNSYVTIPLLAGQRKSYSDIMKKEMDSNSVFQERFSSHLIKKYFPVSEPTFCTFITPTIGRKTLPRTVDSFINQTEWNWKAIVMFDGRDINYSTDNDHVLVTKCEQTNSAGLTRNEAMKLVTTDWIAFCDDDDYLTADYLTTLRQYVDKNDVVIFTYRDITNGNTQPPVYLNDIVSCNVGISFAVRTDFVIRHNIQFPKGAIEDFAFLDQCRNAGARYVLTHQIKYMVGGIGGNQV